MASDTICRESSAASIQFNQEKGPTDEYVLPQLCTMSALSAAAAAGKHAVTYDVHQMMSSCSQLHCHCVEFRVWYCSAVDDFTLVISDIW